MADLTVAQQALRDTMDHASHILKSAAPDALASAAVKAHDLLYDAAIKFYAAQSPDIFALPLTDS